MFWSVENRVQLSPEKCKNLRISFSNQPHEFNPVVVGGKEIEVDDTVDYLGVQSLVQLKREKLPTENLILFYATCISTFLFDST